MGKFTKVCLAAAGIMMGVGIIFCLIGAVFGGGNFIRYARNDVYMSRRMEEAGEALEQMAESLDNVFSSRSEKFSADGTKNLKVNGNSAVSAPHEGQIPVQGIKALHLTLGAGRFMINEKEAGDDTIDIMIQGTGTCEYYVSPGDGVLYVEGFKDINNFKGMSSNNVITMDIPRGLYFQEVEMEVGAGIMEIYALSAGELETLVGAGEVILTNITAEEFSAEIGVGRMQTENTAVKKADIKVNMGNCDFEGSISGDLEAECGMGNLNLLLAGREEDHNYKLECSAGNINLGENSIAALASERTINNGAGSTYELICNMGSITVDFEY